MFKFKARVTTCRFAPNLQFPREALVLPKET